jgi:hypothetical protein
MNFDDNHWSVCCEETNCCEPDVDGALAVLDGLGLLAWPVVAELDPIDEELPVAGALLSIDELLFIDEPPELVLWVCWEFAGGSVLGLD